MDLKYIEKTFQHKTPFPMDPHSYYAVMVPIIKEKENLSLLFELRSHELQVQPGEVCFPGGRKEEGESTEECAIRETCEELCIKPSQLKVIGPLDYMIAYSGFTLYPYLGVIDMEAIKSRSFNHHEVHDTFLVPFDFFLNTEPLNYSYTAEPVIPKEFPYHLIGEKENYNWRIATSEIPIYTYDNHVIWGLTARIVKHLIETLKK